MDSQWLKTQLTYNPDKNKADLAKAIGLQPSGISKILAGTRQIKAHEYIAMRQFFGLPVDGQTAANMYSVTQLARDNGGLREDQRTGDFDWVHPAVALHTEHTQNHHDKIKIFEIHERAMEPNLKEGDKVLIDLSDRTPIPSGMFLVSDGFGQMIRNCTFVPKANPPAVLISAQQEGFTSQTLKMEDFLIIGRVIAKLNML